MKDALAFVGLLTLVGFIGLGLWAAAIEFRLWRQRRRDRAELEQELREYLERKAA